MERVVLNALANETRLRRLIFAPLAIIVAIVFGEDDPTFVGASRVRNGGPRLIACHRVLLQRRAIEVVVQ